MRTFLNNFAKLNLAFIFYLIILNFNGYSQSATLPVAPGMAIVTCYSGIDTNSPIGNPDGFVLGVYDIREPDCNNEGNTDDTITPNAIDNWQDASNSVFHNNSWTARNLGEIFGIDVADNMTNPDIYVTSDGFTSGPDVELTLATGGSGGDVFKIDGTTGAFTKIVSLPNTQYTSDQNFSRYVGLGNISYNSVNNVLYVTNHDDGLIYAIDEATGNILDTYDHLPGTPDDTSLNWTQLIRMTYGVAYNKCDGRLYYAVPTIIMADSGVDYVAENTIFSVALNANGTIDETDVINEQSVAAEFIEDRRTEFTVISDIEFSDDCSQMLLSERSITNRAKGILTLSAHIASTFRYTGSSGNWSLGTEYLIGTFRSSKNGSGGSDFGYSNYGICGTDNACEDAVVIMGDALNVIQPSPNVYGFQISDIAGNSVGYPGNSYVVDLDGNVSAQEARDKYGIGDVDIVRAASCICAQKCISEFGEFTILKRRP